MPNGVTWKWVAATLLMLLVGVSGYAYRGTDQQTQKNTEKIVAVDVDLQQEKVRNAVQYKEIERQLAELQKGVDRVEQLVRQRR